MLFKKRNYVCDTFFDEWGRTFENDRTKHHQTRPDIFVRKVSSRCMTKRMTPHLWWSLLMDNSGDQQMDCLTYTQIHH